jgi:hypothetical protein
MPLALIERDGAAQETDGGGGLLVREDLGVGQPGGVIDGDVDAFPAVVPRRVPAASV